MYSILYLTDTQSIFINLEAFDQTEFSHTSVR